MFLHCGVVGSGYSVGIHDVAMVHPRRSDPQLNAEGGAGRGKDGAHPRLSDTGVQCSAVGGYFYYTASLASTN